MLRIFLTGLALSMPLAAMGQESPDAPSNAASSDAAPSNTAPEAPGPNDKATPAEGAAPAADEAPAAAPDVAKPAEAEAGKPDGVKADAAGDAAQPDAPKPDAAQPDAAKPDAAKPDAPKPAAQPSDASATKPPNYLPNLFDVTVLETWDTLNIREKPDGQAAIIGTLPATAKGVELVGRDSTGKWGKVNSGELAGWVALRFLKQQSGVWQQAAIPQSLSCLGTEPFWSLKASKSGMTFAEPDQPERPLSLRRVLDRGIEGEPSRGLIAGDDKGRFTAFLRPAQCSDGMSDRGYALAVSVIIDGQDVPARMLTGCCSIAR